MPRFVVLYAAMYAAYGVASPFLPAFVRSQGIAPEQLGLVLGAATAVKLLVAPVAGRAGDALHSLRWVLAACIALAACVTVGYLAAAVFSVFLVLALAQAAALAPMPVLADALALENARPRAPQGFEYGWVRGTGSAAFIVGTLAAGQVIAAHGIRSIVWMQAALLGVASIMALRVPERTQRKTKSVSDTDWRALFRIPSYLCVLLVAALVLGSHAMHDAFAVIRWTEAGIGPAMASALWSLAVAAEVLVFFVFGPVLLDRLGPAGAIGVAAAAGVVRWSVMAMSAHPLAFALVQPLHGFTFALLHLACMRVIARTVPPGLEGTGQALYATAAGAASALLAVASGSLYARVEAQAFWPMALLCLCALPVAWKLRRS